jgi:predicted MFS family arabinose efflux permease
MCGFAPSMESLIVARAIAGMGGGGVMTGMLATDCSNYEKKNEPPIFFLMN